MDIEETFDVNETAYITTFHHPPQRVTVTRLTKTQIIVEDSHGEERKFRTTTLREIGKKDSWTGAPQLAKPSLRISIEIAEARVAARKSRLYSNTEDYYRNKPGATLESVKEAVESLETALSELETLKSQASK